MITNPGISVAQPRWMVRADMAAVLAIESACFTWDAWSEKEFITALRQRNCIGKVAELPDGSVGGYVLYELHKSFIRIINLATDPRKMRQGVATVLVNNLKGKLCYQRRTRLDTNVAETNLSAQLFFRAAGFKADEIRRGYYDGGQDAYHFVYGDS